MALPTDAQVRKGIPLFRGLVKYFPHALAAIAQLSMVANEQHNPGEELHWAKEKSADELDALLRHTFDQAIDEEHRDDDGCLAAVKKGWRALADLERMHERGVNIFHVPPQVEPKTNREYLDDALREFQAQPLTEVSREPESYRLSD